MGKHHKTNRFAVYFDLLQVICFFEFGLNFIVKLRFKEATQVYRKKNNENNVEKNVYKCR